MKVKNGKTFFIVLCLQLLCGFVGSNTTTVSECPDSHMRGDIRHGVDSDITSAILSHCDLGLAVY